MTTSNRPIDRKQIVIIQIARRQLAMSDEDYRTMLSDRYWVNSSTALGYDEATDLIDYLKRERGFKVKKPRRKQPTGPNIVQMVSPQQLAKIDHLRADILWHVHDGYNRFVRKVLKKDRVTTGHEAGIVIEALKGLLVTQEKKAGAR